MAMTALERQSEDKIIRQAYQRRKDETYFHNKELADNILIAEQERRRADQAEAEIEKLRQQIAALQAKQMPTQ